MWNAYHTNPILYDENGSQVPETGENPWTGTLSSGIASSYDPLGVFPIKGGLYEAPINGSGWVSILNEDLLYGGWIDTGYAGGGIGELTMNAPLYALSSPITVVPEPGTVGLFAVGAVALLAFARRRHRLQLAAGIAIVLLPTGLAKADVFNMPAGQTSLQFVTAGDPGKVPDTATGYGAVAYTYQMGKYDVTLGQYTQFLNAVAKTDTYGLYDSDMGAYYATQGISQIGSPGSYSYSVTGSNPQAANCPVFAVTWGNAARFCNWLQNGQPTGGTEGAGTTETGAYALNGDVTNLMQETRNPGATYFIQSENEFYKAAYYVGGGTNAGYWAYPTMSNTAPSNVLSATGTNNANYWNDGYTDSTNYLTPVGSFVLSPGPYGTYDMGGDVWQWNETNVSGDYRGVRGDAFDDTSAFLPSSFRGYTLPASVHVDFGFRVASVPEPASIALLLAGGSCLAACAWRRRRRSLSLAGDSTLSSDDETAPAALFIPFHWTRSARKAA